VCRCLHRFLDDCGGLCRVLARVDLGDCTVGLHAAYASGLDAAYAVSGHRAGPSASRFVFGDGLPADLSD
jgi:hypothetical protein